MSAADPLAGWLPFFLNVLDGQPTVDWGYIGQERFTEPFFHETIQGLMARPLNRIFRQYTTLDVLRERAQSHPGLPLRGLIFHMSRCGSTLVAQSLAALSDTVVLSEPEPFGLLLEWLIATPALNTLSEAELLQGMLSALGQPRRSQDTGVFMKTECWQTCHIGRILAAFPGVPWVFLYREPLEVLVSQARMPSLYMIPGSPIQHGLMAPEHLLTRPLEHSAWMMAEILRSAAMAMSRHPGGLLVNYRELPDILETHLAAHFGLVLDDRDVAAMRVANARDSKYPHQHFQADSAEKQASANTDLQIAAAHWLIAPYAELERIRKQGNPEAP